MTDRKMKEPKKKVVVELSLQRRFSLDRDYNSPAVIRVANKVLQQLGGRGSWIKISNKAGKAIYRMIKGVSSNIDNFKDNGIEMDYETSMALEIPASGSKDGWHSCELRARKAKVWERWVAVHWNHPDPSYRNPQRLSYISLFLGIVSLFLGVLPIFLNK